MLAQQVPIMMGVDNDVGLLVLSAAVFIVTGITFGPGPDGERESDHEA